jgi:1-acyl-sn-glycerol-3-phosphate acyltransferase
VGFTAARPEVYLPAFFVAEVFVFLNTGPANAVFVNVALPEVRATGIAMSIFVYHLLGDVPSPILIGKVSVWTGSLQTALLLTLVAMAVSGVFYLSGMRTLGRDTARVQEILAEREEGMRRVFLTFIEALFRVLFTYDCRGEENVPARGPAVVASNHPSYLDPVLLSLQVPRPIRFMAWDALFRVPLLGALIRAFGAFPVDTRRGKGREAYGARRRGAVGGGALSEGTAAHGLDGAAIAEGAARLSWETGAAVPATIAGAYRAWPHYKRCAPARIRVRYHEPIDPAPFAASREVALPALCRTAAARGSIAAARVKADMRVMLLYASPAPPPRPRGGGALAAIVRLAGGDGVVSLLPSAAYLAYLLLDWRTLPQSRLAKWIRNASPVVFLLATGPAMLHALGSPPVTAGAALGAVMAGAMYPYLYAHRRTAMTFLRGMVLPSF